MEPVDFYTISDRVLTGIILTQTTVDFDVYAAHRVLQAAFQLTKGKSDTVPVRVFQPTLLARAPEKLIII